MKVVMIHDHFINEEHGIYTHTHYLYEELIKRNNIEQLNFVTPETCTGNKGRNEKWLNLVLSNYYYTPKQIEKKIHELNPDIVHIHGTHPPHSLLPLLLKNKYKTVVTLHGIVSIDSKNSIRNRLLLKNYLYTYLENNAVKHADGLIAVAPAIKNIIEEKGVNSSKISVIPNGINVSEQENVEPFENFHHPSLFFIGRLVKDKGVDILIKSLPIVKESITDIHLYIAGSGSQFKKLDLLVKKLNLKNNVTFLGYIHGEKKFSYYKSVDLCVLPSTFEALPFVILEAMASGKPVIASNVGGVSYLVDDGKTGFLFESRNYHQLAEKIIELLENKNLRREMGLLAKKKVEQFSWNSIADETVKFYEKIIQE